jgi:hypothetical protein
MGHTLKGPTLKGLTLKEPTLTVLTHNGDRNPNEWPHSSQEALCFATYNHADRIAQLPRTHCGRSYLAVNSSITLPTAAPLGFDMYDVSYGLCFS